MVIKFDLKTFIAIISTIYFCPDIAVFSEDTVSASPALANFRDSQTVNWPLEERLYIYIQRIKLFANDKIYPNPIMD